MPLTVSVPRRQAASLFLSQFLCACIVLQPEGSIPTPPSLTPVEEGTATASMPLISPMVSAEMIPTLPQCLSEFDPHELEGPTFGSGPQRRYTLSQEEFAGYLSLMGIESVCIPPALGGPFLGTDWNESDLPLASRGRMVSIGFEGLYGGGGWGRGYLVYSTYDFSFGAEYDVFATHKDLAAVRASSMPHLFEVDGVTGFIRFHESISMGPFQGVSKTYVFPSETSYLAAVTELGGYDPDDIQRILLEMEDGTHPDLLQQAVSLMDSLVLSLRFR